MEEVKPVQRNSSRTLAIAAVVLLIVVAIAGIVLAGRHRPPALGTAAALPDASPAAVTRGASVSSTTAPTPPGPNDVIFTDGSDKLTAEGSQTIANFADKARGSGSFVRISARYLTGSNKARDAEQAKSRTVAVRHAVESNGIKREQLQVELVEMPAGTLTGNRINLVELSLH